MEIKIEMKKLIKYSISNPFIQMVLQFVKIITQKINRLSRKEIPQARWMKKYDS